MKMHPVSSSQIAAIGYDPGSNRMRVQFHSGGIYEYENVDDEMHKRILSSKSQGSAFHKFIKPNKDKYPFRKIL